MSEREESEAEAEAMEPTMCLSWRTWNRPIEEGYGIHRICTGYVPTPMLQQKWKHRETGETQWRDIEHL